MKHFLCFLVLASLLPVFADEPPELDREAILAMAGEYEVLFNFRETVGYIDGYKLADEYQEEATEIVFVAEDSGDRISLQHVLQSRGRVIKHWKQIWTWQDRRIVEFQGRDRWKVRELSAEEAEGKWSQLVTQVDDSPRYEGVGEWKHEFGTSLWQSNRTARPLPRREHTVRDDYDILMTTNRHAITPHGWVHEQDSLKLALEHDDEPARYLVGETGVNYYDRTDETDFTEAREYWEATQPFWNNVSETWESIMESEAQFTIAAEVDGRRLYEEMFGMAESLTENSDAEVPGKEEIRKVLERYVSYEAAVDRSN